MPFRKGQNPNHPRRGAAIKVDPIRDLAAIARIKRMLIDQDHVRDYCLFTLGINTAWRANELLSLTVGDVRGLKVWDDLVLKQSKNRKYRITPLNPAVHRALEFWLVVYGRELPDAAPLFPSYRYKGEALRVPSLCNLVKRWCACAGVQGNYGSHTLRKTWGYQQRLRYEAPLSLLVKAYGHSSERITLDYLGIQPKEITDLYRNEI
jgi:integrase